MIVAQSLRLTRVGGKVLVQVQCKYGIWYTVFEEKFSDMTPDQPTEKQLPDAFYPQAVDE